MARVSCGGRRGRPPPCTTGSAINYGHQSHYPGREPARGGAARAGARRDESHRLLRSAGGGSSLSGRRVGDRERGHGDPPGGDERRGERPGQSGAQPPRQGPGHPARRAAAEEHGDHRGDSREGDRQVRQARRRHCLAHPRHQPLRDADRHRHLRDQMQGRGHLLAAPRKPAHHQRGGPVDARGVAAAGRSRRHPAVGRAPQHSARQRADGHV